MTEEAKSNVVLSSLADLAKVPEDQKWQRDHCNIFCTVAARCGRLERLRLFHENGCPWDEWTCISAAENGHLECLIYAHENKCPWNEMTCAYAALNGHLECLKYAHDNECPWDELTCQYAAQNGHLECLKYAHENNCPWNERTWTYAAEKGRLECLKYAHEHKCPWDERTCTYAAKNGHLECLKYAHEHNCPWDKWTCAYAAEYGYLECLEYAHENNCPWDEWTCANAAKNGHLECLQYAHEKGCPWDADTCISAAYNGHIECLKYAHANKCPRWDPKPPRDPADTLYSRIKARETDLASEKKQKEEYRSKLDALVQEKNVPKNENDEVRRIEAEKKKLSSELEQQKMLHTDTEQKYAAIVKDFNIQIMTLQSALGFDPATLVGNLLGEITVLRTSVDMLQTEREQLREEILKQEARIAKKTVQKM